MITMSVSKLTLPDGLEAHPPRMEDIPALTAMFNASSQRVLGVEKFREDDMVSEWSLPGFDPETNTMVVWDKDHDPIGYIELWDLIEPRVVMNCWMRVHPDYEQTSIGLFLLDWAERRARQALPTIPADLRVVLRGGVPVKYPSMQEDFLRSGFELVRQFWTMVIDLDQEPPAAQFPEGITVRSMRPGEERMAIRAFVDSFQDHWGFVVRPFEEEYRQWKHFMDHDTNYDPNLWFFAMDGDEIAGFSFCRPHSNSDHDMGWIGQLGVLRPWRKKGLGLALLQYSFEVFYKMGKPRVGLGVDSSSLTGATRLYEKGGMRVDPNKTSGAYEKELRPGIDLSKQKVEE